MTGRAELAFTLYDFDSSGGKYGSRCFKFGSTWGCKIDCPAFQEGKCEIPDKEKALEMINSNCDEDEAKIFFNLYPILKEQ